MSTRDRHEVTATSFERALGIVRAAFAIPERGYFTPGELCYRWHTENLPGATPVARFWTGAGGQDTGFAWLSEGLAHLVCVPGQASIEEEMLNWAEQRHAESGAESPLGVVAMDGDVRRQALLARRGYGRMDPVLVLRERSLDTEIPTPALPGGYALCQLGRADDDDDAAWALAYRQSFSPEQMSVALRRAVAGSSLYLPELDIAISAPDGSLAAFALAWYDAPSRSGAFEPLGCVPAYRRKGLSTALLGEGMRRLKGLGATSAFVTTVEHRRPANLLYDALGFRLVNRRPLWQAAA